MKLDAAKRLIAHKLEEEWIPGVRGYHYAVGCILLAADTMKFSFQLRAPDSDTPNTYGCWGGSIDGNEEAFQALKRELREETGYTGELRIYPLMTYYDADKGFQYYNNLVVIPMQMEVAKNGESAGDIWVPYGEWPTPLHPGLQGLLNDRPSMFTVEQVMKNIERAEANGQDPMRTVAAPTGNVDPIEAKLLALGLSKADAKLYRDWTFKGEVSPNNLQAYKDLFVRLSKAIPSREKDKLPSVVYRGLTTANAIIDKFKSGVAFRMKPRLISSWTSSKEEAIEYTDSYGLLLHAKPENVILYIGPKVRAFLGDAQSKFPHHNKNEVICDGSLVPVINKKTAELINY